ncbi:MAG TPA: DUF4238 domain-containing protein, partial [Sphingomonas sp.]|uniref:DUF4238 domain-containing protein n=1 Tax=Sphingomonas sp. TaxID=28214 RepID=UPI002C57BA40
MSETRDNHFVPQWYQRGFFEPGRSTLAYLDMQPEMHMRGDGTPVLGRSVFSSTTTQCFRQYDLYTTFFGFAISDEIERRLFGEIDRKGTPSVAAFAADDVEARMRHFVDFFEYMDAQKLRTPKGLAWLRRHYPFLDQNQLMFEMQGVRRLHCSLWAQCVREIVSAEDSDVKFLISDHPVTVYNHAVPPGDPACAYPNDPSIAWKGSQTLYPLNRDFCLILTNLEYAKDPDLADPRRKRTNAKNFGDALVRTDIMIRTRKLDARDVVRINHVLKARATRHVAAGSRDWLYPEQTVDTDWACLRETLLPPKDELWNWGGETYIGFADGSTAYQDAHGRSEPGSERLLKSEADHPRTSKDACGCGSGKRFGLCCATRPAELRPSWSERSIRERNLVLIAAVADITGLGAGMDWTEARRGLTSDKIAEIYTVFRALWPPETDIFALLPKPDGRLRGLFTGMVDPRMLVEFAVGAADSFGEVLIQNPFPFAGGMKPEFDPTKVPGEYRFEVLKHILMLLELAPLIETGAVNFFPDPCNFDRHLRQQMMQMAEARAGGDFDEAD